METKRLLLSLALAALLSGQTHSADNQANSTLAQAAKIGIVTTTAVATTAACALAARKAYKKFHYAYIAKNVHLANTITPDTTILLDLDDTVLTKPSYGNLVWQHKKEIASSLKNNYATAYQLWHDGSCSEEWQERFRALGGSNSNEHAFADVIQKISQDKEILPDMDTFVQKLHDKGFTIQPLTNMGENDYKYLEEKYPTLFGYFTNPVYVTYDKNQARIKKPMAAYFSNYKNQYPHGAENCIMIDDKPANCAMAHKILGCSYMVVPGNSSNAEFLTKEFAKAGVKI